MELHPSHINQTKLISKFTTFTLEPEDATLILHCLKDSVDSLPDEFFNEKNWKFIAPSRDSLLEFIYSWRYEVTFNDEKTNTALDCEPSADWREDLEYVLLDYARRHNCFLLPYTNPGYHLASFIFVSNSLRDYFSEELV